MTPRLPVSLEQFRGLGAEYVTERVEGRQVDPLWMALRHHQPVRRRDGNRALARLGERVGRALESRALHQLGQSQSHSEHVTNVTTEAEMFTSGFTVADISVSGYIQGMATEPVDPVQAIDDSNAPEALCVICRASYRAPGSVLCPSCAYVDRDDSTEAPSTDRPHGHAA